MMFSDFVKYLEEDLWKQVEAHFGNTKEAVTTGDFITGNTKIEYLNFHFLRILSLKIDELGRSISEIREVNMGSFEDLVEYVFDYSKYIECEHWQKERLNEIKYYYHELRLSFEEIKKVKDLIKDVKKNSLVEITSLFYRFYAQYKDFEKLTKLIDFIKGFDLTKIGWLTYKRDLENIIYLIEIKGIEVIDQYKDREWQDMANKIYDATYGVNN